jgi:N-acetylmuramoyl-L-alanine amidase
MNAAKKRLLVPAATGTETYYRDSIDRQFAELILSEFVDVLGLRNRGVKHESESQHPRLSVLDFGGSATLVEMGFITNKNDLARVMDRDNRIAIWTGIGKRLKGEKDAWKS